jgi:DNA-binding transcriptional ArsR family regulator
MSGRCIPESAWRRSYDIDDARAQVSAIYWQVSERNEHAFRFFDVIRKAIWQFSDHVRRPGKPLPICANAMQVFEALIRHMDFRTGRCDPSLDTIAATCKLSRRTVVRHLDVLRRERLIDWARRTLKKPAMRQEKVPSASRQATPTSWIWRGFRSRSCARCARS